MRKVHYRVVLDVFVHENESADVNEAILCSDFLPELDGDGDNFSVIDVSIDSVEVTDSR